MRPLPHDFSACANATCPSRKQCWRFVGVRGDPWQVYADFKPDESGKCDSFVEVRVEGKQ